MTIISSGGEKKESLQTWERYASFGVGLQGVATLL